MRLNLDKIIGLAVVGFFCSANNVNAQIYVNNTGECCNNVTSACCIGSTTGLVNAPKPGQMIGETAAGIPIILAYPKPIDSDPPPVVDPDDGNTGCFWVDYGDFVDKPNGDIYYCLTKQCVGGI